MFPAPAADRNTTGPKSCSEQPKQSETRAPNNRQHLLSVSQKPSAQHTERSATSVCHDTTTKRAQRRLLHSIAYLCPAVSRPAQEMFANSSRQRTSVDFHRHSLDDPDKILRLVAASESWIYMRETTPIFRQMQELMVLGFTRKQFRLSKLQMNSRQGRKIFQSSSDSDPDIVLRLVAQEEVVTINELVILVEAPTQAVRHAQLRRVLIVRHDVISNQTIHKICQLPAVRCFRRCEHDARLHVQILRCEHVTTGGDRVRSAPLLVLRVQPLQANAHALIAEVHPSRQPHDNRPVNSQGEAQVILPQ